MFCVFDIYIFFFLFDWLVSLVLLFKLLIVKFRCLFLVSFVFRLAVVWLFSLFFVCLIIDLSFYEVCLVFVLFVCFFCYITC